MEINKAFEIITGKVERLLLAKGYKKQDVAESDKELTALYTSDNMAYSMVYYFDKKRVLLRSCGMEDGEPDNAWKTIATWLFDPEADTQKDAENISEDFAETIRGPKQTAVQKQKKNKKDNGEHTSDPLFFANRMVGYFPELRDEIAYEKAHYESFRGITFAQEKIMPKFRSYINTLNKGAMEKFSKSLSELYDAGDLDVKGIITYILLNSIEDDEKYEKVTEFFTPENKKIADESRKLRGKKIKPEKPKKPSKLMAQTLNDMQ